MDGPTCRMDPWVGWTRVWDMDPHARSDEPAIWIWICGSDMYPRVRSGGILDLFTCLCRFERVWSDLCSQKRVGSTILYGSRKVPVNNSDI